MFDLSALNPQMWLPMVVVAAVFLVSSMGSSAGHRVFTTRTNHRAGYSNEVRSALSEGIRTADYAKRKVNSTFGPSVLLAQSVDYLERWELALASEMTERVNSGADAASLRVLSEGYTDCSRVLRSTVESVIARGLTSGDRQANDPEILSAYQKIRSEFMTLSGSELSASFSSIHLVPAAN